MSGSAIPKATAKRLPLYYRYLSFLAESGTERISSTELADAVKVDSATIRRDFSYFGALGKRGYGYDVKALVEFFKKTLSQDHLTNVGLVGLGSMGQALLQYNFRASSNIRISAAFDEDEKLIGTIQSGVPVYDVAELEKQLSDQQIRIVILTVDEAKAQAVATKLVAAGVRGIMNFTPVRLTVPKTVHVQNIDLATELQTIIYFLDTKE
ncbi:redox-sensing transcriptional repressor Rex [Lacticaseibacillus sharpeae]|uniref:Redox-sensing transcriptional repressor Rex n=1 Tax=Lacticaseibacillus sharpeae JCM 1186 = DSM 20505 TaxID=1291052 RepID=A0A0R1ZTN9_9LACO|nr:redox-sensing transcriptional repressor Rex [Lacticaseibacillus sharpeae]KRM54275.1 redox-sensing transcriptional repressor Rex [Lacticaseibacillus sharpeae JCM 1186 = DSM 20505]